MANIMAVPPPPSVRATGGSGKSNAAAACYSLRFRFFFKSFPWLVGIGWPHFFNSRNIRRFRRNARGIIRMISVIVVLVVVGHGIIIVPFRC